jgi:hypothetical protein
MKNNPSLKVDIIETRKYFYLVFPITVSGITVAYSPRISYTETARPSSQWLPTY